MNKEEKYQELVAQVAAIVNGESDEIANMANVAAVLHEAFGFWWTGFYLVKPSAVSSHELVLGPFQGPIACTRIPLGKGVCGTAWERGETVIVGNVHEFKGHIACSAESNSEIVVPIRKAKGGKSEVTGVLDIDSKEFNTFDETDKKYLEEIVRLL
ncbi:MAG: GAF domain-containing protein [Paludibacteraceae bacterium]|nr:GAF domain-containing protein [Paludibacteraceae bacterium]